MRRLLVAVLLLSGAACDSGDDVVAGDDEPAEERGWTVAPLATPDDGDVTFVIAAGQSPTQVVTARGGDIGLEVPDVESAPAPILAAPGSFLQLTDSARAGDVTVVVGSIDQRALILRREGDSSWSPVEGPDGLIVSVIAAAGDGFVGLGARPGATDGTVSSVLVGSDDGSVWSVLFEVEGESPRLSDVAADDQYVVAVGAEVAVFAPVDDLTTWSEAPMEDVGPANDLVYPEVGASASVVALEHGGFVLVDARPGEEWLTLGAWRSAPGSPPEFAHVGDLPPDVAVPFYWVVAPAADDVLVSGVVQTQQGGQLALFRLRDAAWEVLEPPTLEGTILTVKSMGVEPARVALVISTSEGMVLARRTFGDGVAQLDW